MTADHPLQPLESSAAGHVPRQSRSSPAGWVAIGPPTRVTRRRHLQARLDPRQEDQDFSMSFESTQEPSRRILPVLQLGSSPAVLSVARRPASNGLHGLAQVVRRLRPDMRNRCRSVGTQPWQPRRSCFLQGAPGRCGQVLVAPYVPATDVIASRLSGWRVPDDRSRPSPGQAVLPDMKSGLARSNICVGRGRKSSNARPGS